MPDSSTILLVDDEDSVQKLLTYPLERDGFRVVQARDGEQALRMFGDERIDLVVLDLMLPKVDGLEVCKRLRADSNVPIIMLTARGEELDKVLGLELGADDYITKPFSIREFRSRVRALLRRAALPRERSQQDGQVIESGDLRIDPAKRTVELGGEPVQLTYVEFELLRALAAEPGRVFTREMRASPSTSSQCVESGTDFATDERFQDSRGTAQPCSARSRRAGARTRLPDHRAVAADAAGRL